MYLAKWYADLCIRVVVVVGVMVVMAGMMLVVVGVVKVVRLVDLMGGANGPHRWACRFVCRWWWWWWWW